jgi:hypothetical protein
VSYFMVDVEADGPVPGTDDPMVGVRFRDGEVRELPERSSVSELG